MVTFFSRGLLALSLGFSWSIVVRAADPAPAAAAPAFDPLAIPQTTEIQPLLKYIEQVAKWHVAIPPEQRKDKAVMAKAKEQNFASRAAMLGAIDKALALKLEETDRVKLLRTKLDGLRLMSMMTSDEQVEKQLDQDYETLTRSLRSEERR